MTITAKQAAERAGCSISTLRRYECGWCGQLKLYQYQGICGGIYDKCNPDDLPKFNLTRIRKAPRKVEPPG